MTNPRPLLNHSNTALGFGFGRAVSQPGTDPALLLAIVDELGARGLWTDLIAQFDEQLAMDVNMQISVARSRTGRSFRVRR